MKKINRGLLMIGVTLLVFFITGHFYESKVIGEEPCVDGEGRPNLNGIMCEKRLETFFGLSGLSKLFLLLIIAVIWAWILFYCLIPFTKK